MKLLYEDSKKYLTILSALLSRKDVTFKGETDYYSLEMIKQEDFYKIEKMMNYMLGFPLAIYMYNMVKDDYDIFDDYLSKEAELIDLERKKAFTYGYKLSNKLMIDSLRE